MIPRLLQLPKNYSFFLFGARGVGKTTLIHHFFDLETCCWIDLLKPNLEAHYARSPEILMDEIRSLDPLVRYIIIDEVQKLPKLLNVVHALIESTNKIFILTGSSARKLQHGGANLLAGRAFVKKLFPFSYLELGAAFDLDIALTHGMLPKVWEFSSSLDRSLFLEAYTYSYLKEEVWAEHLVQKLDPFRQFLEVAAQSNGKILNYSKIAKDCGVDDKTVKTYFNILEDTWVGFSLDPYQSSFRKRLSKSPKFYFFDLGIARALARTHRVAVLPQTYGYGNYFEQFIITECYKLCQYYHPDYRLTYLRTKDDLEIDLMIDRPGLPLLLIEIKSTTRIDETQLTALKCIQKDLPNAEYWCLSLDPAAKLFKNGIRTYYWQEGLKRITI